MWPFRSEREYHAVADEEEELTELRSAHNVPGQPSRSKTRMLHLGTVIVVLLLLAIAASLAGIIPSRSHASPADEPSSQETVSKTEPIIPSLEEDSHPESHCPRRKEWRTASSTEQQHYINSVLCLRTQKSTLAPKSNKTAHDDYPWIHSHVGYHTHNSAPCLPWRRYFLHIYESTLRKKCAYTGSLMYWDWTLDSEHLEGSPVFDAETGFGGDGEVGGEIRVGRSGRCVIDGPFAGITADYYDVKYQPHCLSRGFRDLDGNLGHIDGRDISPESIEKVLSMDTYQQFVASMESRIHDAIPFGIAGDFETFTAPYDPLFFLHHTQLDRLWWLWQQRQPGKGLESYGGHKERHSIEVASLEDDLRYRGLAQDVQVKDVMDIESGPLCYRY